MKALPFKFYGDPADCVDTLRKLNEVGRRDKERVRILKGLRIRALVKQAMKGLRR